MPIRMVFPGRRSQPSIQGSRACVSRRRSSRDSSFRPVSETARCGSMPWAACFRNSIPNCGSDVHRESCLRREKACALHFLDHRRDTPIAKTWRALQRERGRNHGCCRSKRCSNTTTPSLTSDFYIHEKSPVAMGEGKTRRHR